MDSPNIISIREHIQSHRICQNQDSNCFFSHSKVHAFSSTFYSPPLFFLLKDFLKIQTIFKVFTEFFIALLSFYALVFWPWDMRDLCSLTRDQTRTPSKGRQSFNHWMARKVPQIIHSFVQQTPHHWECHCPGLEIARGRGEGRKFTTKNCCVVFTLEENLIYSHGF